METGRGAEELGREVGRLRERFRVVSELGMRLATSLDPTALLPAIVTEARRFTASEAGSLYVREGDRLVFSVLQNDRLEREGHHIGVPDLRLPLDGSSLAGLAAMERRTLNIRDAREHPSLSRKGKEEFHYDVESMLVVPMTDQHGEVVGVLQLMNALEDGKARPYSEDDAELCTVLASHAATALHVARLYAELNHVFDSLVRYTAAAIDARDPCTAGHSSRVAVYATRIASELGGFSEDELRELRFAGIFHDVGKLGVRECVLTKSDKLAKDAMEAVRWRFAAAAEARLRTAMAQSEGDGAVERARLEASHLAAELEWLQSVNEPRWMEDAEVERIAKLHQASFRDWTGRDVALLTESEHDQLVVRKGNLTASERREIEQHAELGFKFLEKIPFPKTLARVPDLVHSHHEKLNGSGYPRGLAGDQIPLQGRILAVADVFDALTAADRPYKKAMVPERALEILERERDLGYWDPRVVGALRALVAAGRLVPRRATEAPADASPIDARDAW